MLPKTRTQPPPAKQSTENLTSGDFIAADVAPRSIPRAPRVPRIAPPPATLRTPEPWLSTTQASAVSASRPSTRPIPSRPIYQNQPARPVAVSASAPPPMSEAALADFFAEFERTSALPQAPVPSPAWGRATTPMAPSYPRAPMMQSAPPPAPHSLAPVAMTADADDSGRMNVQRGDTKNGLVTSRTFVIETKKGGGSWAAFMVAFGALVGVLASMAVVKYKADQQQRFAAASQQDTEVVAPQVAVPQVAAPQVAAPQIAQAVQPTQAPVQTVTQPAAPAQTQAAPVVTGNAFANVAPNATASQPMQSTFSTGITAPKADAPKASVKADAKPVVAKAEPKAEPRKIASAQAKVLVRASAPAKTAAVKVATKVETPAKAEAPAKTDSAQRMLEAAQRETGNSLN